MCILIAEGPALYTSLLGAENNVQELMHECSYEAWLAVRSHHKMAIGIAGTQRFTGSLASSKHSLMRLQRLAGIALAFVCACQ